ncbi:uncharacterized protein LY79DRAFT_574676 [Colletotrichum navitas]|uniref:Uncharacterized protein n=1 Tax=Colletotrichum navitas TaxID=681940 RepID=A0AAD8VCQ0_9PEZI|nr:uncharacterized protein LY79DRAFT_574676 [Colletotrichum navitas]KAK1600348.1 hypothetical protein LY79DRAFT_574676 [Colletotrichum navitas]
MPLSRLTISGLGHIPASCFSCAILRLTPSIGMCDCSVRRSRAQRSWHAGRWRRKTASRSCSSRAGRSHGGDGGVRGGDARGGGGGVRGGTWRGSPPHDSSICGR